MKWLRSFSLALKTPAVWSVLPLLLLPPLLSGCVGWTSEVPPGLRTELRLWEPAPVTTRTVAFGLKTNLTTWSFTEHEEIESQYAPLTSALFPNVTHVPDSVAAMFGPADWPGDHDYAVRVQYHWNGCAAVTTQGFSYGVDSTGASAGAVDMGAGGATVFLYGAGAAMQSGGQAGGYMAAGMLGLSAFSMGAGIGLALAFTGVGLVMQVILPHYYQLPVTATLDVFDRRRRKTTRLVLGVVGNLLVWPPLAFIPVDAGQAWDPTMHLVTRWSMKALAEQDLWQGIYAEDSTAPGWRSVRDEPEEEAPPPVAAEPKTFWPKQLLVTPTDLGEAWARESDAKVVAPGRYAVQVQPRREKPQRWYGVRLEAFSRVTLELQATRESGDWIYLELCDPQGRRLKRAHVQDGQATLTWEPIDSGVHRFRIYSGESKPRGELRVSITPPPHDPFEPNDTWRDAAQLPCGAPLPDESEPSLTLLGDEDWYQFDLPARGIRHVRLELSPDSADLDFDLYDHRGKRLAAAWSSDPVERLDLSELAPGRYYLRVYGAGGLDGAGAVRGTYRLAWATSDTFSPGKETAR